MRSSKGEAPSLDLKRNSEKKNPKLSSKPARTTSFKKLWAIAFLSNAWSIPMEMITCFFLFYSILVYIFLLYIL